MRLDSGMAAHAVELPVRQHAQQAGLPRVKRHIADFVQKERAALGLLKAPTPLRLRTGEGAALMAKQFGLSRSIRDGRRVDGHERPVGHGRMFVQRARHQLLARTRFAGDEHRDHAGSVGRWRETRPAWRAPGPPFRGGSLALFGHLFALAFDRARISLHRFGQIKRLWIFKRATLEGQTALSRSNTPS